MTRPIAAFGVRPALSLCACALAVLAADARAAEPLAAAAPAAAASGSGAAAPSAGLGEPRKVPMRAIDYAIPAAEIVGFDVLLNRFNRYFGTGREDYAVNLSTIRQNLHSGWSSDRDPFNINQLGHPYQGSMYFGFARSAGFNYWESAGYTFAGSGFWEISGERTPPSINDQVASGIGGTFLGEALFRMSNLVLEQGGGLPRFWREVGAAAISPATGFNRLVFRDRYGSVFSSHDAAYYSRLGLGYVHSQREDVGITSTKFQPNEAQVDFSIDYGLPGEGLRVHAAVRLLQLPGHGVERKRLRERADARPAGRQALRGRAELPRRVGHLRQLRLHLAADLPCLDDGAVARHDRPLWMTRDLSLEGTGCSASATPRSAPPTAPPRPIATTTTA